LPGFRPGTRGQPSLGVSQGIAPAAAVAFDPMKADQGQSASNFRKILSQQDILLNAELLGPVEAGDGILIVREQRYRLPRKVQPGLLQAKNRRLQFQFVAANEGNTTAVQGGFTIGCRVENGRQTAML